MTHPTQWRGITAMLGATACFVINDSFCKVAMADLPPMQVLFLRGISATGWCLLAIVALGLAPQLSGIFNRWVLLRAFCELTAVTVFYLCLSQMPIADVTAIMQIAPLLVLVGAAIFYREKIALWQVPLILAGFAGAIIVANPGLNGVTPLLVLSFLMPIGAAFRDLLARKVPAGIHGLVASFAVILMVMSGAGLATVSFEAWKPVTGLHLLYFLAAGLFIVGGLFLILAAFRLARSNTVAPFLYSFMFWAVLAGILVFGDVLTTQGFVGMAMILIAGIALAWIRAARESSTVS